MTAKRKRARQGGSSERPATGVPATTRVPRTKQQRAGAARPAAAAAPPASPQPTPEQTAARSRSYGERWRAFWFERPIELKRLALFRVLFFGMLGLDQLYLMVEKAYRYGAGGFNVAQLPALDRLLPLPNASVHTVLYLLGGFLALRIALGIAVRASLLGLCVSYGYTYFSSLHDAYQHHYLIFWILVISLALPLERTGGIDRPAPAAPGARAKFENSWGVALLYCQVAIVYLFTALSKASEYWLNGWALRQQISTPWIREALQSFESTLGLPDATSYALLARVVFAWELVAALAFVLPKLRPFACISGPVFHASVELIGLDVRWFSYYMIVTYYVLLLPDAWFQRLTQLLRAPLAGLATLSARRLRLPAPSERQRLWLTLGAALLSGLVCASSPLPGGVALALLVGAAVFSSEYLPTWAKVAPAAGQLGAATVNAQRATTASRLLCQLLLAGIVFAVPRYAETAYNFYRFKAGDLSRRGETEAAIVSYRQAIELNPGPDSRHEKLARLLLNAGRASEALPVYQEALRLRPNEATLLEGLAKTLEALGRDAEARELRARRVASPPGTPNRSSEGSTDDPE